MQVETQISKRHLALKSFSMIMAIQIVPSIMQKKGQRSLTTKLKSWDIHWTELKCNFLHLDNMDNIGSVNLKAFPTWLVRYDAALFFHYVSHKWFCHSKIRVLFKSVSIKFFKVLTTSYPKTIFSSLRLSPHFFSIFPHFKNCSILATYDLDLKMQQT